MVKLIALDLDGTLLTPKGEVTQTAKDAITTAREAGIKVVLNTGRPIPEAIHFSKLAGCDALLSCLGGAALVDADKGEVLFRQDISEPSGRKALELCLNREIELMIFAGNEILLDSFSKDSLLKTYPYPVFHENAKLVEDPLSYMNDHGLPLTKIHADWNPENYPLKELGALDGVSLTSSSDHDFEVVAHGVDKGRTLARLALLYGIALQDCAAVGDSDNDLGMLRIVGTPIAMGNASEHVKEVACRMSASNEEEGVAKAILSCIE